MKKFLPFLVAIAIIETMVVLSTEGYAWEHPGVPRWRLYDNFNSGVIDTNRWTNNLCPCAEISIEDGRVKFVHKPNYAGWSAWLIINKAPEKVKGIKAKVTVESCSGDVTARVAGFVGKVEDDYVFNQFGLQGGIPSPRIFSELAVLDPSNNFAFLYDLFYAQFIRPLEIIGHTFTITMIFSRDKFTYEVDGLGEIEYELRKDLDLTDDHLKAIGTRSSSNDVSCVVYFDDVYILQ